MDLTDILESSIIEEITGAEDEFKQKRFKNSLILYSKAVFSMCDLIILQRKLKLPENHPERFRILERYAPKVYRIVDKLFKKYTDTYLKPSGKESCEAMKNAVKNINRIEKFGEKIKTFIEKI